MKTEPKPLKELSPTDVEAMNYSELIGITRETARPCGGFRSIEQMARIGRLGPQSRVLEVGTSTGFGAIELAALTGCRVDAIDIDDNCLKVLRARAARRGVGDRIDARLDDAMNLSAADGAFDMVVCGNMTALLPNQEKAIAEYTRVLRPYGIVASTPMYYVNEFPPADLLKRVSAAQAARFVPQHKREALALYDRKPLQLHWCEDYRFDRITDDTVAGFVDGILREPHLSDLSAPAMSALSRRYGEFIRIFRDNLAYMGFSLALWRKDPHPFDPELFTSSPVR